MTDTKRHPAAISGGEPAVAVKAASTISLSEAATHEKQKAVSSLHPAHGCSMKYMGKVKRANAGDNGE